MRAGPLEGVWLAQPCIDGHCNEAHPVRIEDGQIALREGPGLGVVPEEAMFGDPLASFRAAGP